MRTVAAVGAALVSLSRAGIADAQALPQISVPSAILVDVSSGQTLFAKDIDRRFMPASLTKVMTTYVAFELISQNKLALRQRVRVSDYAFKNWARVGSTMFLGKDDLPSVDQLLMGITTVSANDGCVVLAEAAAGSVPAFIELMNATARSLGMKNSHFGTPNGWMDDGNTYTTTHDLAILSEAMIRRHPDLYGRYVGQPGMIYRDITQTTHNPLLGKYPGADGIKTGFTNQAGYGLIGSAARNGRRLISVVAGADTPRIRSHDTVVLMDWGYDGWSAEMIARPGQVLGRARVQGGTELNVPLIAQQPLFNAVRKGAGEGYTLSVRYRRPLVAPLRRGQEVASLVVQRPDSPETLLPLVAAQAVPAGDFLERLWDGFLALVGL